MLKTLTVGDFQLTWLCGGSFHLDGGAMFGVVPKALWQRKYPCDDQNYIPHLASPILLKTPCALMLIDTGIGNKLTEKQRKIFRVQEQWRLTEDLFALGLSPEDIDTVILSHFDWDHAGGVVKELDDGSLRLTFPRARHVLQRTEWEDVLNPHVRAAQTYWPINHELLAGSGMLQLVDGMQEVGQGVTVVHTGGHNRGHQIVMLESGGEKALHLADLLPTHAHFNPLWVMAYDNYPLESIRQKQHWEEFGIREHAWFTFYHDAFVSACRFDMQGAVTEKVEAWS
jgi:glyoxylase-like metal-dependent hydrolase (beta-lactamase superfamily II)